MLYGGWRPFAGRQAEQGLFERAGLTAFVARGEVPGGRRDDLVTRDAATPDAQPVTEAAAGGFDQAAAAGFVGQLAVGAEGFPRLQGLHPALHGRHDEGQFEQAGDDAGHDAAAVTGDHVAQQRVAGDDLAGQGANLEGLPGVARGLAPGVGTGLVGGGASASQARPVSSAMASESKGAVAPPCQVPLGNRS